MKIETIIKREDIYKINDSLPEKMRWPNLEEILYECEQQIKFVSLDASGFPIFIGWAETSANEWFYHHAICLSHSLGIGMPYGFHDSSIDDVYSGKLTIAPVFNIGSLPESVKFAKILRKFGIKARKDMPVLSRVELYERNRNNRHTRVLR